MVKTLNNLLRNQKADDLETWYAASGARVLPSLFKDDPGLTLTYFTARPISVPNAFVWEKGKTMDFFFRNYYSYDIKVGRCSQLNEYMTLYEYQRSRSFIDLGPNHSDSIFLNFFSSITTWSSFTKFYVESPWHEGTKVCSNCLGHMTKMATMPIYGKIL